MNSQKIPIIRQLFMDLPKGQSAFLWGPRQVGKTTFLEQKYPQSTRYDLLEAKVFWRFKEEPWRFKEELLTLHEQGKLKQPIILDEVQKLPELMDTVHELIEKKAFSFILCGSSPRKLKSSHANLLGGRAWRYEMKPFTFYELKKDFDLIQALNRGLIPRHYFSPHYQKYLQAYRQEYLKEEIQLESQIRNLKAFSRFLESVAYSNGEMVNFSNIAQDCHVDAKTVRHYFEILTDTLIGDFIYPWAPKLRRNLISARPKFYLFDVGVALSISKTKLASLKGPVFGKAFEHFLWMELNSYLSYQKQEAEIQYWRTNKGEEVDFILGQGQVAIEVKGSNRVTNRDLKSLEHFKAQYKPQKAILVCQEAASRKRESEVWVMPWKEFLLDLWEGRIF